MKVKRFVEKYNVKLIIALTVILVCWVNFNQQRWVLKDVIAHDITNYNSYLPALFYERDLSLSFLNETANRHIEALLYAPNYTPEGKPVIKMSMGMALTYLPFFGMAHVYCKLFNYPANGFSEPYHFALLFSSLVYHLIGLLFLWRVLRLYFNVNVSTLTLFCLGFATNVFYYLTMAGALSHTVDFMLMSIFLFYLIRWKTQRQWKFALYLGLTVGLLTLVRPINGLVFIFIVLFVAEGTKGIRSQVLLFWQLKWQLLILVLSAFMVVLPQLLYWKYVSGHYFFNSYVGEHFFFTNPHILKALFGFRKGWLIYTPIMVFSLFGFLYLKEGLKEFRLPLLIFFVIYVYVAFSWWCWWYGGSFGQRVLIDIYPLLALPFAAFLRNMMQGKRWQKQTVYVLVGFFTALNLFQSMQAKYNIIHYDSMTARAYFKVFGTTSKSADREKYLDPPDYEKAKRGEGD